MCSVVDLPDIFIAVKKLLAAVLNWSSLFILLF